MHCGLQTLRARVLQILALQLLHLFMVFLSTDLEHIEQRGRFLGGLSVDNVILGSIEIGSSSFSITCSVSNKIHAQSIKKQVTSLWLSFVEVWIYGEENDSSIVDCNIQQVPGKYHGPTSTFVDKNKFIYVVNCSFVRL